MKIAIRRQGDVFTHTEWRVVELRQEITLRALAATQVQIGGVPYDVMRVDVCLSEGWPALWLSVRGIYE